MFLGMNCDMGEGFSLYKMGDDEKLMPLIEVANVACGFHASDPNHMRRTLELAKEHGVRVGAHPSLPDLQGFGRREMKIGRAELANLLIYQVGALCGFLKAADMELNHIKPHGALYGMAARDEEVANAICDVADVFGVPLYGLPGTLHEKVYPQRGHKFVSEYYADLDYDAKGMVVISREHKAFEPEEAARKAVRAIKEGMATSIDGTDVRVNAETICVHSDTPNAVDVASVVRQAVSAYVTSG